jgi:hypothetical protein
MIIKKNKHTFINAVFTSTVNHNRTKKIIMKLYTNTNCTSMHMLKTGLDAILALFITHIKTKLMNHIIIVISLKNKLLRCIYIYIVK